MATDRRADLLHELLHATFMLQDLVERHVVGRIAADLPESDMISSRAVSATRPPSERYDAIIVSFAALHPNEYAYQLLREDGR
jgi:hypothetical protein